VLEPAVSVDPTQSGHVEKGGMLIFPRYAERAVVDVILTAIRLAVRRRHKATLYLLEKTA
jgi:hypothetical protein